MRTALACIYGAMAVLAAIVAGDSIDAQVKALVDTLTVDQLLAQMNQIDINSFKASDDDGNIIVNLTVVEGYANMTIGSYLNSPFGDPRGTKYNLNATEYRVQLNKMQALHLKYSKIPYVPNATYYQGINIDGNYTLPNGTAVSAVIDEVLAAAKDATVTVVALGEYPYAEDAGNGTPQPLPSEFLTYLKTLKATGTKIVLVLVEGRPRTLNGLADLADAVLWAGLPCELGGRAIADVLFGKVNPSGKLPYTYPKTAEFINLATPYYQRNSTTCFKNQTTTPCEAEFPYGYGLSYTTFAYSSARINTTTLNFQQKTGVRITVNVKNTGTVAGKETVMLFLTPPPRANAETKLLKKFTKINLQPNEATDVVFDLLPDDWGYYAGEIGQGLVKSAPSGLYVFAFKATTDCAVNPKDALCLTLQWTNTDNAPVTADKKSTDGGSSSPSSSKSGSAVTSVSVASLVLALVSLIQL
ncbi:hypothetical protein Ae201684P_014446 [Aphanomyces euteiches]|nr:hypothetical protein Ae201684P_014446 [Aphanomyces euteiches]